MRKRTKVVLILLGIAVTITAVIAGVGIARNLSMPEYKYIEEEYTGLFPLILEDIAYTGITQDSFEIIKEKLENENEQFDDEFIVETKYPYLDSVLNYNIYGNKNIETRILLRGEDSSLIDSNLPDMYFCRLDVLYKYISLAEYQYIIDEHTIKGDGVIYKEVSKVFFDLVDNEFAEQDIHVVGFHPVGVISQNNSDSWVLILYGWKEQYERILLVGKERDAFYYEDFPEVYYCREDIYDLFKEHGSFEGIDLREYLE